MSSTDTSAPPAAGVDTSYPRATYSWWVIFVLTLALIVSYVDRHIVSILVEPMKRDLGISDAQAGWLFSGFAIFYALAGLPLARWADSKSRRKIIVFGILAWSAMTVACGLARNFWQLFAARVGVGVGEATIGPATNSLVGDYFPRKTIPLALSFFQTGAIVGSGLAFLVGGIVVEMVRAAPPTVLPLLGTMHAWQMTFIYVGAPGILVVLMMLSVREPVRRIFKGTDGVAQTKATLRALGDFYLLNRATILTHHLGLSCINLIGWAFVFWTPSFFERVHGLSSGQASQTFGLIFIIFGPLGGLAGAYIARYLSARGHRDANILGTMVGAVLVIPSVMAIQIVPNLTVVWILYMGALAFMNMPFGLGAGALPVIAPPNMRAQVAAIYSLFGAFAGMGLGPVIAGAINDHIFTGADGVRYSLMLLAGVFGPIGVLLLSLGRKHYAASLDRADNMHELSAGA